MTRTTPKRLGFLVSLIAPMVTWAPEGVTESAERQVSPVATPAASNLEQEEFRLLGLDVSFQPRLYGGAMYYKLEQFAVTGQDIALAPGTFGGVEVLRGEGVSPFEVSATLPVLGGGGDILS